MIYTAIITVWVVLKYSLSSKWIKRIDGNTHSLTGYRVNQYINQVPMIQLLLLD